MSDVSSSRVTPRPPTAAKRQSPSLVKLWRPDGTFELVLQSNVSDLCRLNGNAREPRKAAAIQDIEVIASEAFNDDAPSPPAPIIDGLRNELVGLGGQVDPKWGIKSLNREIDRLKSANLLIHKEST